MDVNTLAIYIHELRNQCLFAEASFANFNEGLKEGHPTRVFCASQGILTSASAIAALLWPKGTRARRRGEILRNALQLPEKHPLGDRRLVAFWEQGDEKTDTWANRTKGEQILSDYIGPKSALAMPIKDSSIYRAYDPETNIFYFRGQSFHMQGVANALMDVARRINAVHARLMPHLHQPQEAAAENAAENQGEAAEPAAAETSIETAAEA